MVVMTQIQSINYLSHYFLTSRIVSLLYFIWIWVWGEE